MIKPHDGLDGLFACWDYRVLAVKDGDATYFVIHEVYYDNNYNPVAWIESPSIPAGENILELHEDLKLMLLAFDLPTLTEVKTNRSKTILVEYNEDTTT